MASLTKKSLSQLEVLKKEQLKAIEDHQKREFSASNKTEHRSTLQRLQKRLSEIEVAIKSHK